MNLLCWKQIYFFAYCITKYFWWTKHLKSTETFWFFETSTRPAKTQQLIIPHLVQLWILQFKIYLLLLNSLHVLPNFELSFSKFCSVTKSRALKLPSIWQMSSFSFQNYPLITSIYLSKKALITNKLPSAFTLWTKSINS